MKFVAVYARILILVIAAQCYAAGLAIFGAASFTVHALTGWAFILLALALAIGSLVSKARRSLAPLAMLILLMSIAQPALALGLRQWPWIAGLHPLVGLMTAGLLIVLARRSGTVRAT